MTTYVGHGVDAHPFGGAGPVRLGGVTVASDRGLEATSDGDVAVHALIDALLGAAALGDIGTHFPQDDPASSGADSMGLLHKVAGMVTDAGFAVGNVDITIVAETVRIAPYRDEMIARIGETLGTSAVSVKATTTDGMGLIGAGEGIAAVATASLTRADQA